MRTKVLNEDPKEGTVKVTSGGIPNPGSSRLRRPAVSVEDIFYRTRTGVISFLWN